MYKILKIVLLVIGLLSAVLWLFMPDAEDPNAINSGAISGMFIIMFILVIVAALAALIFGLSKLLTTPGGLKKALFGIGALIVFFIVGYALSSGDEAKAVVENFAGKDIQPTESTVKNIGMLLNVFFIMVIAAIVLMVVPGVKRIFGK